MRLRSCRLRQVRQHGDLELSFGTRLTLIGGPNEAGKSTLVEALHKGLFLRSTATGRGVEDSGVPSLFLSGIRQGSGPSPSAARSAAV